MTPTILIFADQRCLDEVLAKLGANIISQEFSTWNGRLHVFVPGHREPAYFVDKQGELHPLDLLSHAFPDGSIYHTYVPRNS